MLPNEPGFMAARVLLLLGIFLFTEIIEPVFPAGTRNGGSSKKLSKADVFDTSIASTRANASFSLDIRPKGLIVLGKKGTVLNCYAGHNHEISWLYNGEIAPPCGPFRCHLSKKGSLHIFKKKSKKNQSAKDQYVNSTNEFRCIAHTNYEASYRSAPVNLFLSELYTFEESPENLTVQEGQVSRLACIIDSVPSLPKVVWKHDDKIIFYNDTRYLFVPPGTLFIKSTKLSDAGSYRCTVTNEYLNKTKESKETILIVTKSVEYSNSSILYAQNSYNYTLLNGSSLLLVCAASGYPTPTVEWSFISNDTVSESPVYLQNSSNGLSVLKLKNINISDAGSYICIVRNSTNNKIECQIVMLKVIVPPKFLKKPLNQICPNGRTARFDCQAYGFPQPQIYWLKNSENITIEGRKTVYEKENNKIELAISATVPTDSGIYQCVAVNEAGEIWAAGRLQVNASRNSPSAPTPLQCRALSPIKIFISWSVPKTLRGTDITAYTVHYSPLEGGKEEVTPPEAGNATYVEITKHLEPYTNYSIYIRVWNNHGASNQSTSIICSTAPSVPIAAPKLFVNESSGTKLNISWIPLMKKEAQGIVTEYKLQWKLHQHPSIRVLNFPANITNHQITDLIAGESYDVRVLARTEEGWPNISESKLNWVTVTMSSKELIKDFLNLHIVFINASAVQVQWQEKSNNLKIESWKISFKNDKDQEIFMTLLPRDKESFLFSNLDSNSSYNIQLCAVIYGENEQCTSKKIEKNSLANEPPSDLEAKPISSNSIRLKWHVKYLTKLNLFEVCYRQVHHINQTLNCILVNGFNITIDKLKPFKLYEFKVRVINDKSTGMFSETVECYTNEDTPGKVEDVQWFLVNGTKVRVAWKQPHTINGIIKNYHVQFSNDLSEPRGSWKNVTVFGNKTSVNLPNLTPGKRYFVAVQAATKAGFGMASEPIVIVTSGNAVKGASILNDEKPVSKIKTDQSLGIILGIMISIGCIAVCLCSIYWRKKYENSRILRESVEPQKTYVIRKNGNGCCFEQSKIVNEQPALEMSILDSSSPVNEFRDSKGGHSNGHINSCAKEPLLTKWGVNGQLKNFHITENPQLCSKRKNLLADLNCTDLTMISYEDEEESLNNNKTGPVIVPVLEPNG